MVNWTWHVGIEVLKADEVHMRKRRPHREQGGKKSITTNVLFRFQKEGQGTRLFHVLLSHVPPYEMNDLPHSPKYISVEIRSKANTSVANLNRVWLWACKSILRLASNSSEKLRTDIDPDPPSARAVMFTQMNPIATWCDVHYVADVEAGSQRRWVTCSKLHHPEQGEARILIQACPTLKPMFYLKSFIFMRDLWNSILSWETKEWPQIQ